MPFLFYLVLNSLNLIYLWLIIGKCLCCKTNFHGFFVMSSACLIYSKIYTCCDSSFLNSRSSSLLACSLVLHLCILLVVPFNLHVISLLHSSWHPSNACISFMHYSDQTIRGRTRGAHRVRWAWIRSPVRGRARS